MRPLLALGLLLALAPRGAAQAPATHPDSARIVTVDVPRFWAAYDRLATAATRADSLRAFDEAYFAGASPGLAAFIRVRLRRPDDLLFALRMLPRYYGAVRANTLRLHEHEATIRDGYRRLQALYPAATFPDLYFVVGGFSTKGTLTREGLLIGAEMVSADADTPLDELPPFMRDIGFTAATLPCIVVHELVHHQQRNAPGRSLLAQVLLEGAADFVTQQAVGCHTNSRAAFAWGDAREAELWAAFQREMHGTDYGGWLYNGNGAGERPANLGYWMGYRIAEAFYDRAPDKRQALHDLLHITDPAAFLQASGYASKFGP